LAFEDKYETGFQTRARVLGNFPDIPRKTEAVTEELIGQRWRSARNSDRERVFEFSANLTLNYK